MSLQSKVDGGELYAEGSTDVRKLFGFLQHCERFGTEEAIIHIGKLLRVGGTPPAGLMRWQCIPAVRYHVLVFRRANWYTIIVLMLVNHADVLPIL